MPRPGGPRILALRVADAKERDAWLEVMRGVSVRRVSTSAKPKSLMASLFSDLSPLEEGDSEN